MKIQEKTPKVSVCVVTYNQEKYIGQCLQSIVDQKTDFDFEVIVGDDCSTDRTRAIVQKFAELYPIIVKPKFHQINIGATGNYLSVHRSAIGEYISHIDGDDFIRQGKLQAQSDFLDRREEFSLVAHCVNIADENGVDSGMVFPKFVDAEAQLVTLERQIALGSLFLHSSLMYRKTAFPQHLPNGPLLDWLLISSMLISANGFLMSEVFGTYRVHKKSFTSQDNNKIRELKIDHCLYLSEILKNRRSIFFAVSVLDVISRLRRFKLPYKSSLLMLKKNISFPCFYKVLKLKRWATKSEYFKGIER